MFLLILVVVVTLTLLLGMSFLANPSPTPNQKQIGLPRYCTRKTLNPGIDPNFTCVYDGNDGDQTVQHNVNTIGECDPSSARTPLMYLPTDEGSVVVYGTSDGQMCKSKSNPDERCYQSVKSWVSPPKGTKPEFAVSFDTQPPCLGF